MAGKREGCRLVGGVGERESRTRELRVRCELTGGGRRKARERGGGRSGMMGKGRGKFFPLTGPHAQSDIGCSFFFFF